jgi:hypothetical protein
MKKMDEMDRNIRMRSESWGYRVAMTSLSIWIMYNSYKTIVHGAKSETIPVLILLLGVSAHNISMSMIKRKMVAGDDEYKEPNKFIQIIITTIVIAALTRLLIVFLITLSL